MEQGPSWEASWFAAGQEIPRVLWNPKVPKTTNKGLSNICLQFWFDDWMKGVEMDHENQHTTLQI